MRFAIILSGCGQHDGSETHETILTLLALSQENIDWDAFAPDVIQKNTINHLSEKVQDNSARSVLVESARLVRGKVKDIKLLDFDKYDAVIFPGGVGSVNILCNWLEAHALFQFNTDVEELLTKIKASLKPTGFICIAPIMIPKIYTGAHLTIGNDPLLCDEINNMGGIAEICPADDVVVDFKYNIVTTPANMVAKNINEVFGGISKLVSELKALCKKSKN